MKRYRSVAAILTFGMLAGCQDLTLDDENRPSLEESLGSINNIELSVRTAINHWLGGVVMGQSISYAIDPREATFAPALQGLAEELTFSRRSQVLSATTVLDEPRTTIDHRPLSFTVNKAPYADAYTAIASCHDVRMTILARGYRDGVFPNWRRAAYMCKLIMGYGHLYLGTMFDKAIIVPDDNKPIDVTNQTFVPHDSVIEFAKTLIREGIQEALDTTSLTPSSWFNTASYSNVDMAKIAYGYLARAEVWKAATPAQREDISNGGVVDWDKVIQYVDSSLGSTWTVGGASAGMPTNNSGGMAGNNFTLRATSASHQTRNAGLFNLMYWPGADYFRVHHKVIGQGDTTGAYANYLRTPIAQRTDTVYASPDRRLPRKTANRHINDTLSNRHIWAALADDGNYFQLLASTGPDAVPMSSFAGPPPGHRLSSYQFIRFGDNARQRRSIETTQSVAFLGWQSVMSPEELRLLKAEAYIRLGQPALAVPLINVSRTAATKGQLPPVGINGPQESLPRCVPRSYTNAEVCGNLMDALLWEKRLESLGTDLWVNWADWRAFGYLEPGSVVYFPPSYRDTEAMGFPYYSYGGSLPGSASAPAPCGSGTWQSIGCMDYVSVSRLPTPQ